MKRAAFFVLLLLGFAAPAAHAQATIVRSEGWVCSASCASHTLAVAVTAGDAVEISCTAATGSCGGAVSSSPSATWTCDDTGSSLSNCYALNAPAVTAITFSTTGEATIQMTEMGYVAAAAAKDVSSNGTAANGSTFTSATITTTTYLDIIFVVVASQTSNSSGATCNSPYTLQATTLGTDTESLTQCYLNVSSVGANYATGNMASGNTGGYVDIIAFRAQVPGAGSGLTRTGSCTAAATSCTFSSTFTGDLKIIFAYRSGSTTAPSLPSGWTTIASGSIGSSGTTGSYRIGCEVSSSATDSSSGTWTNATRVVGIAYAGTAVGTTANCNTTGVGATSENAAQTSTTVTFNALTLNVGTGTSWVAGFAGSNASMTAVTPTGMKDITSAADSIANDTSGGVSSWSVQTVTVSSRTWISYVAEILAASGGGNTAPPPTQMMMGCCRMARAREIDERRKRA